MSEAKRVPMTQSEEEKVVFQHAYTSGLRTGFVTSVAATGLSFLGHTYWPFYRNRLGVSGKLAIPVMAGLAAFTIRTENMLLNHRRNPDEFMRSIDPSRLSRHMTRVQEHKSGDIMFYHKVANWIYDYPFRSIAVVGIPVVAGIFLEQNKDKKVLFSQRIMHTRIYGQASIVAIVLSAMAFHDWMEKRGKFE